jgi:adenylate kinase family enzyme
VEGLSFVRIKLFILGHPGSGKSYAAGHIRKLAGQKGWNVSHFNDYTILRDMSLVEAKTGWKWFRPSAEAGGVDVFKEAALDDALKNLEVGARTYLSDADNKTFGIIEFARKDYNNALRTFQSEFWQDAYLLFIPVDRETGLERIRARAAAPKTKDDHPLSEYAWQEHYSECVEPDVTYLKSLGFKRGVDIIMNEGSLKEFNNELERYLQILLGGISSDAL